MSKTFVSQKPSRKLFAGALSLAAGALSFAALAAFAPNADADEIRLKDGSVVYGKIADIEGGIVSITPGYNADGSVKVFRFKIEDVLTFSSNDPIFLGVGAAANTTPDNTYNGVVETAPAGVRIKTSTGVIPVPLEQVKLAYRTREDSPEAKALKKLERKWTAELTIDARGKEASARQVGTSIGLSAVNAGPNDKLTLTAKYNYYKSREAGFYDSDGDGSYEKSTDDFTGGIDYRCNFTDNFLWYIRTNDGYNKVTFVDFFSESAVGLGWQAIKEDKHKLEFRVGAAFRYETYHHGHYVTVNGENKDSQSLPGLDIGMNYSIEWSWGKFTDAITYLPAFDDFGNFILHHEAAIEFPVANSEYWSIRFGFSNDYNAHPANNASGQALRKLETTYFARIVLRVK